MASVFGAAKKAHVDALAAMIEGHHVRPNATPVSPPLPKAPHAPKTGDKRPRDEAPRPQTAAKQPRVAGAPLSKPRRARPSKPTSTVVNPPPKTVYMYKMKGHDAKTGAETWYSKVCDSYAETEDRKMLERIDVGKVVTYCGKKYTIAKITRPPTSQRQWTFDLRLGDSTVTVHPKWCTESGKDISDGKLAWQAVAAKTPTVPSTPKRDAPESSSDESSEDETVELAMSHPATVKVLTAPEASVARASSDDESEVSEVEVETGTAASYAMSTSGGNLGQTNMHMGPVPEMGHVTAMHHSHDYDDYAPGADDVAQLFVLPPVVADTTRPAEFERRVPEPVVAPMHVEVPDVAPLATHEHLVDCVVNYTFAQMPDEVKDAFTVLAACVPRDALPAACPALLRAVMEGAYARLEAIQTHEGGGELVRCMAADATAPVALVAEFERPAASVADAVDAFMYIWKFLARSAHPTDVATLRALAPVCAAPTTAEREPYLARLAARYGLRIGASEHVLSVRKLVFDRVHVMANVPDAPPNDVLVKRIEWLVGKMQ